jgi:hypothetical protein
MVSSAGNKEESEMSQLKPNQVTGAETADSRWNWLYRIGGAAAMLSVVIVPIQIVVFMAWPPPSTIADWFALFQNNGFVGLLAFEFLFVVDAALGIPTILALYIALRRTSESFMAIALAVGLVASVALITARPAFEMLYLSSQYAAATTEAQRSILLAAGEAMRATFYGTAFNTSNVLGNINLLIVPLVMLRSNLFGKATAYMGILAGILGLAMYVPTVGLFLGILSALFLAIWRILIAVKFFQLGRGKPAGAVRKE